ncbi:MAG: hypothetical protein JNG86_14970, partial [Verrucomicrobiaceae bacterium]|nr:hypothetical protein [Verrucomicrobiaceae bacterium]
MTRFSIVPALALLLTTARGDDEPPQRLYRTEVFTLPRAEAAALLAQPLDGTALHAKLVEAAAKREALLEKLLFIKSQCGAQSSVEQTDHFEYPTENDPAQATQTLVLVNPEPGKADHAPDPATKETVSPFNAGLGTLTTTTPTAFEMRPLGDSLELDCSAEGVLHYKLSSTEWLATDHLRDVPLPVFGTRSLEGETRLKPGQTAFLGTYSHARNTGVKGQRDAGKVALAFITATEAPVPKPAEHPVIFKHASLRATLEILSMDKAAEHTLVLETHDEQKIYERLVQHGTRDSTLSARGTLGTQLRVSNADEFISPVEFDPPQIAGKLIIADSQLIKDLRSGRQTGLGNPQTVDGGNPNG